LDYGNYFVSTDGKALLKFGANLLSSKTVEKNPDLIKNAEGVEKAVRMSMPNIERLLNQVEYPEDGSKFVIDIAKLEELIAKLPKKNKTRIEDKATILFYTGKDYTAINHKYLKIVCSLAKYFGMDKVSIATKLTPSDMQEFDFGGDCKFYAMPMRLEKVELVLDFTKEETVATNNLVYHS